MPKEVIYQLEDIVEIDSYGGVHLPNLISDDFVKMGYEVTDLVEVSFLDKTIIMPVVNDFNAIDMGKDGLTLHNIDSVYVKFISFGDLFAVKYGIVEHNDEGPRPWKVKEGVNFPITITIKMYQKHGYANDYKIFNMARTNERIDYEDFSDYEFANFREVICSKLKPGLLYRGSSPIDPALRRHTITDDALKEHGVKSIINLVNREEIAKNFPGYYKTYYSKQNILFMPAPIFFYNEKFFKVVRETVRFMLTHEGPYFIHCWEGKDRTGYIVAIFLCLIGGDRKEIVRDFVLSYINFFKIAPGSESYMRIALRIYHLIKRGFGIGDVNYVDLPKQAYDYLIRIGLSEDEVNRFILLLSK